MTSPRLIGCYVAYPWPTARLVAQCHKHDDCSENPALGRACTEASMGAWPPFVSTAMGYGDHMRVRRPGLIPRRFAEGPIVWDVEECVLDRIIIRDGADEIGLYCHPGDAKTHGLLQLFALASSLIHLIARVAKEAR